MKELSYEIIRQIAILSETKGGWTKELNYISWNGRAPKYDLRDWSPNREKMGKGVTLSEEEVLALRETLNFINIG